MSAKKRGEMEGAGHSRRSTNPAGAQRKPGSGRAGKQRSGDLGRALRSVYDDTLREPVPDDFLNLIGKLS